MGLAFKPNIDDLRESPAVTIADALLSQGRDVLVVEPNVKEHTKFKLVSLQEALERADVIAVLVKHQQFLSSNVKQLLGERSGVLDFCGSLAN